MIYSIIPEDVIFEGYEQFAPVYVQITYEGILMDVEPVNMHQARIVRIYSPNPQHYLIPRFAPGELLNFMRMNV